MVLVVFLDSRFALKMLIKTWAPNRGPRFTTALLDRPFPDFRRSALHSSRAAAGGNQHRRLPGRKDDATHGDCDRRRHGWAGGHGICSQQDVARGKGSAGPATAQVQPPADHFRRLECGRYVPLRVQAADHSEHRRFCPPGHRLQELLFCLDLHRLLHGDDPDGRLSHRTPCLSPDGPVRAQVRRKTAWPHVDAKRRLHHWRVLVQLGSLLHRGELRNAYDFLPAPTFQEGGLQHLWEATGSLHQHTGIGNRADEYHDLETIWNSAARLPDDLNLRYPAAESFAQAQKILEQMPDGFFMWVHVMTPHMLPIIPVRQERGRFIPDDQLRTFEYEEDDSSRLAIPPVTDRNGKTRLTSAALPTMSAWPPPIATSAIFMSELESSGKLQQHNGRCVGRSRGKLSAAASISMVAAI